MAEAIITQWHLAVLRAQLDLSAREPRISTEMFGYPDGTATTLWSESYPVRAFGIPEQGPPSQLVVPDDLVQRVGRSLYEDLSDETALWLRLAPPYGYLGAVPWEEILVPRINRPVLRVPDRLPVAADFGDAWTMAIALHARPGTTWAPTYLRSLLTALRGQVGGALEVHVFADAQTTAGFRALAAAEEPWLHLHDPATAGAALESREASRAKMSTTSKRSSWVPPAPPGRTWADWIAAGLAGRAVRSLHVVIDADFDGDRPMLVVSADPNEAADPQHCTFVPVDGLLRLTDSLGAATLSMGSPPDNLSDVATRMVVDQIGQQRPGPTIYSSISEDPEGIKIASAHAYLADRTGDLPLPWDRSLFAYVQPEHVRASLLEAWPEPSAGTTGPGDDILPSIDVLTDYRSAEAESMYETVSEVPAWVAVSHRYLGNEWARLARTADPSVGAVVRDAYDKGAAEALDELRSIIDRHSGS